MERKIYNLDQAHKDTDEKLAEVLFGSGNYKIVGSTTDFKNKNPERYKAIREIARVGMNRVGTPIREQIAQQFGPKEPRRLSTQELHARLRNSRAEDGRFYRSDYAGSADNLQKIKESDPARYALIKLAHDSYASEQDLIPIQNRADRFEVVGELAVVLGLPPGSA